MIIIDTGPIIALLDRDDKYHRLWHVKDDLWRFIKRGGIKIEPSGENIYSRCRELI